MKLMSKSLFCGLAAAAITAVGCSSGHSTGGTGGEPGSKTGEIGAKITLQGGQTLASLNYTLSNGTPADSLTGTIPLPTGTAGAGPIVVSTFEILPVIAATGYTLTISGTSTGTGPVVTCTGSAGPFAVTAGNETVENVLVTCTVPNNTGSVEANITIQNCPTEGTLTAINATASTTAPGNTSTIFAAAVSPNEASLTYAFSILSGGGTLSGQTTATGNVSSNIVFTCPATAGVSVIQVVTADQTGASCPASLTTASVSVTCGAVPCLGVGTGIEATGDTATGACPAGSANTLTDSSGNFCCAAIPCFGVGSGTEATPDLATGTCPAGQVNDLKDSANNFCCEVPALKACTTTGQANCVQCTGNQSSTTGVCTPTEAAIVNFDIKRGNDTASGAPKTGSCYQCLLATGCLDDTLGDTGLECEDTAGSAAFATGTTTNCEATLSCVLGSGSSAATQCNSGALSACYCGAAPPSGTCVTASTAISDPATPSTDATQIDGQCDVEISQGLGFVITDGTDNLKKFTDSTRSAGRALSIFACGNACAACK